MWIDDDILERCAEPLAMALWVPDEPLVVLGSSNAAATEVEVERCDEAGIPVLKRYGGGGTVVLHNGCVVLSLGAWVSQQFQNKLYFELLNQSLIDALAVGWPPLGTLSQRGLSDIVAGDLKVAGTSLFRSRNYLLYQVSLLVEPEIDLVARYLKHPSKEPDYRRGRSHKDFITGLARLVPGLTPERCLAHLEPTFLPAVRARLASELVLPIEAQYPALQARLARARSTPPA